ncbi:MAG: hypothetical protein J3R72DRAFT_497430 [Linnemannia gamsii]|nr:MAG: hypothetical protein J3R72DRAFT_497430 [Linnemannia gamsii]
MNRKNPILKPPNGSQITNPPTVTVHPPTVKPPTIRCSTTKSSTTKSPTTKSSTTKSPTTKSATTNLAKATKVPVMSKRQSKTRNNGDPNSSKEVTKHKSPSAMKPTIRKRSTAYSETDESDLEATKS